MVGFLNNEPSEQESNNLSSNNKLKNTTVDPAWSDSFDFLDQFVPEIDDLCALPGDASFLDLDSIKDWFEEMQEEPLVNVDSGIFEMEPCNLEGSGADNAKTEEVGGIDERLGEIDSCGEGLVDGVDELGGCGEGLENSGIEKGGKLGGLDVVVEEGLGKVSLVDEVEITPVGGTVDDESSSSESESESESSDSDSSSEEDDVDDVVVVGEGEKKEDVCEVEEELEEGEIMEPGGDKTVHSSNEDDDDGDDVFNEEILMGDYEDEDDPIGGVKEPIMSKNELKYLPPVPPVDVTLQSSHQMLPVGAVTSVLGAQVIVEGGEKHNPLSEGSILWITERRSPLGRVDEIFGPVKTPYYIVRYNSESEVPEGIQEGILVSFVPEFVDHVLNNQNLYQKGYDASGDNDEEVLDEAEFSDDEKEAEYRRMMKVSKRGNNTDMKPGGNKKSGKNFRRNDMHPSNYHQSNSMQTKDSPSSQAGNMQNHQGESPMRHPTDCSIQPGSSRFSPSFPAGPGVIPGHPQQCQSSGFPSNAPPPNGMPFQMQNGPGNGFQMPWIQQQHLQQIPMMMNSGPPFQQAFNSAGPNPNNMGQSNSTMGPSFSPFPPGGMVPNALNQSPFSMALQAQLAQLSMLSGVLSSLGGQGGPGGHNMQHLPPGLPQNGAGGNNMQHLPPGLQQNGAGGNNMQQHLPPGLQQNGAGGNNMQHLPPGLQQNGAGGNNMHHLPPGLQQNGAGGNNMQHRPPGLQQNGAGGNNMQPLPPGSQQNGAGGNNMQHRPPGLQQNGAEDNNLQQLPPGFQQNGEAPPPQFNQGQGSSHRGGRAPFQRRGGRSGGRGGRRGGRSFQSR